MITKGVGTGSLQARILVGVLGVAALAVATRSVLVLGYAFAVLRKSRYPFDFTVPMGKR